MVTDAQVAAVRAANLALAKRVEADLADFWRTMDLSRPIIARNALLNYVPLLAQEYGDMASTVAADWFEELRFDAIDEGFLSRVASRTSRFAPKLASTDLDAVASDVRFIAGDLFTDTPDTALPKLQASASRTVLQTGRETTRLNTFAPGSGARGWQRRTSAGACKFCRAMAAKGAVYSRESVRFASHAPTCHCVAVPSWDRNAPEVPTIAYVASANTASMSEVEKARHRADVSAWLEKSYPTADKTPATP